jgi:hypothetical protein
MGMKSSVLIDIKLEASLLSPLIFSWNSLRLMARSVPDISHHIWCLDATSAFNLRCLHSHLFAKDLNLCSARALREARTVAAVASVTPDREKRRAGDKIWGEVTSEGEAAGRWLGRAWRAGVTE